MFILKLRITDLVFCQVHPTCILGDPGIVSGGGESLNGVNGREKKLGEEKSRTRERAPKKKIERNITPCLFVLIDSPRSAILFSFRVYYRK